MGIKRSKTHQTRKGQQVFRDRLHLAWLGIISTYCTNHNRLDTVQLQDTWNCQSGNNLTCCIEYAVEVDKDHALIVSRDFNAFHVC